VLVTRGLCNTYPIHHQTPSIKRHRLGQMPFPPLTLEEKGLIEEEMW